MEDADGTWSVRKTEDAKLVKPIGWRVSVPEFNALLPFIETFPNRAWSEAFRWLFAQPAVKALIAERVQGALEPRPQ